MSFDDKYLILSQVFYYMLSSIDYDRCKKKLNLIAQL